MAKSRKILGILNQREPSEKVVWYRANPVFSWSNPTPVCHVYQYPSFPHRFRVHEGVIEIDRQRC